MLKQDLTFQIIELERSLPNEKKKKVIGVMKDELGDKIIKIFVGLRAKTYSYLIDDGCEDKNANGIKKCHMKRKLKFEDYKNYLEPAFADNVFTEEINKIYLSSNDDKRIQSVDSIETYVYGTCKDLVYKKEETKCNNIVKQYKEL